MTLSGKPEHMSWLWWSVYKGARALGHVLQGMNNWGEWFADEIGITRPMYQDLIDQHNELVSFRKFLKFFIFEVFVIFFSFLKIFMK